MVYYTLSKGPRQVLQLYKQEAASAPTRPHCCGCPLFPEAAQCSLTVMTTKGAIQEGPAPCVLRCSSPNSV
jgi:hypothetical protein